MFVVYFSSLKELLTFAHFKDYMTSKFQAKSFIMGWLCQSLPFSTQSLTPHCIIAKGGIINSPWQYIMTSKMSFPDSNLACTGTSCKSCLKEGNLDCNILQSMCTLLFHKYSNLKSRLPTFDLIFEKNDRENKTRREVDD